MNIDKILDIINGGECINVEFKQSKKKLNKDVYDTCQKVHKYIDAKVKFLTEMKMEIWI